MSKARRGKVVVLGVGNELLMDEGIGVHVARELAGRTFAFRWKSSKRGQCSIAGREMSRLASW